MKQRKSTGSCSRIKTWIPSSKKAQELKQTFSSGNKRSHNISKGIRSQGNRISIHQKLPSHERRVSLVERNASASEDHIGRMLSARNIKKRDHKLLADSFSNERRSDGLLKSGARVIDVQTANIPTRSLDRDQSRTLSKKSE